MFLELLGALLRHFWAHLASGPLEAFLESWAPSKVLSSQFSVALVRFFGAPRSSAVAFKGPSGPLRAGGGAHTFIFKGPTAAVSGPALKFSSIHANIGVRLF